MNAPTFDAHSSSCPICRRSSTIKPHKLLTGLLTCKHCQEKLVISWSGHYVRDPFIPKQLNVERMLRRDSHPFYRILRDLQLFRSRFLLLILVSSAFIGVLSVAANPNNLDTNFGRSPSMDEIK